MKVAKFFHLAAVSCNHQKTILGAACRHVCKQRHATKLGKRKFLKLLTMNPREDFVYGMLQANGSKCFRSVGWFVWLTKQMNPSCGPAIRGLTLGLAKEMLNISILQWCELRCKNSSKSRQGCHQGPRLWSAGDDKGDP